MAFRALLATFVLTRADLRRFAHEEHGDIIEWGFAFFLLALGLLALQQQWLFENVCMGIITGSANLYKKFALLLICTGEFRQLSSTLWSGSSSGLMQHQDFQTVPLLTAASDTG